MYLVLFVLHNPNLLHEVLAAWEELCVGGVTILPSTGLGRLREKFALQEDFPMIPSLENMTRYDEILNRTIFTVVDSEELVEKIHTATVMVTGDFDQPKTGIMIVLPILRAYGINKKNNR